MASILAKELEGMTLHTDEAARATKEETSEPRQDADEYVVVRAVGRSVVARKGVLMQIPFFEGLLSNHFKTPFKADGSLSTTEIRADCLLAVMNFLETRRMRVLLTDLPRGVSVSTLHEQLDFMGLREKVGDERSRLDGYPNYSRTGSAEWMIEVRHYVSKLRVKVPMPEDIDGLHKQLTDVHDEPGDKYEPSSPNVAGRQKAREAAPILCLALPLLDLTQQKMPQRVWSWTVFVAGHWRTFPPRLRYHFKRTASSVVSFTAKQSAKLDEWSDDSDWEEGFQYSDEETDGMFA